MNRLLSSSDSGDKHDTESEAPEEEATPEVVLTQSQALKKEIMEMKAYVNILEAQINLMSLDDPCKPGESPCPKPDRCTDFEVEVKCSKQPEICALQRNQFKLQVQMKDLTVFCQNTKNQITILHDFITQTFKDIEELQKEYKKLADFQKKMNREFVRCGKRYEFLKEMKAEAEAVHQLFEDQKKWLCELKKNYVSGNDFHLDKSDLFKKVFHLRKMMDSTIDKRTVQLHNLEKRLKKLGSMKFKKETDMPHISSSVMNFVENEMDKEKAASKCKK